MDNASSGNVVIFDLSPEQSVSTGVDVIVIEWQWLPQSVLHDPIFLKSVFRLPLLIKMKSVINPFERDFLKIAKINSQ